MNEIKKTEPITQENLPEALKDGRITQAEVDRIWGKTEFVSAQTPIEVRMMLVKLQDVGINLQPHELTMMSVLLDMRAAMTKDESKFAHLVAGTETIVKTLQNVNPLMRHLERQQMMIDSLGEQLSRTEAKLDTVMQAMAEGRKLEIKHEVLHGGDEEAAYLAETTGAALATKEAEPVEEEYDGQVGSAWDAKNPAKGPVKLPTSSDEYEQQSKAFRERVLKHK
jgi:hypothetical protein